MDPSVIKVPSVITFGHKHNKSLIHKNILNPSVKKVLSVITFGPKCNKGLICYDWDNMRHVHGYLNLQGWHHGSCDQTEREKNEGEKIPQNLEMAFGLILTNS